ncbi:MAG: glycosyltransferase family 4 protein [Planctomycetaceae bacterium]|nr:glycosyltransferase family 4 protein [Planctomycetaceae bacterium]
MSRQTRVLILLEYATLNGGEHSLLSVLPEISRHFEIRIAGPTQGDLARHLEELDVSLIPCNLPASQMSQVERRQQLKQLIQRVKPDLIHANSLSMSRLSGPICRDLGIPSLGHLRDMMRLSQTAASDVMAHSRLLAVSSATRDWYRKANFPGEQIHVVHNGVDLLKFSPRSPSGFLHQELGLAASTPLIGSIGQIGIRKGVDQLLETMAQISEPTPQLVLVGQRHSEKAEAIEYENQLHQAANEQLAGRVHFLGRRDDVDQLLPEFTILAHFARQEPLGRVLLEAAASGCCIVATDVGGTSEIFPPTSGSAALFSPSRPSRAAEILQDLLHSARKREQMGEMARKRAHDVFGKQRAATHLMQHYHALTAEF